MKSRNDLPVVTIAGRKNVGKSSIFNRLVGYRRSLVADYKGLTRDPVIFDTKLKDRFVRLVDLPGYFAKPSDQIESEMTRAFREWINESALVLFVVDGRSEITREDVEIADLIRKSGRPFLFVVNKTEHKPAYMANMSEIYSISMGEPILVAAEHNMGFDLLVDEIVGKLPLNYEKVEVPLARVAIVGKPNVGKSSLINAILGEKLSFVTDIPGTTRDTIDATLKYKDIEIVFMDTAGLRKRRRVQKGTVESFSGARTIRAIQNSDVCVLVVDSSEGITTQDQKIASTISEYSKAAVIAMNKWDVVIPNFEFQVAEKLFFINYAPQISVSAKNSWNVEKLLDEIVNSYNSYKAKIPTSKVTKAATEFSYDRIMPSKRGSKLKIYYATQISSAPPHFVMFVNFPELFNDSMKRALVSFMRRKIPELRLSPIQITLKARR